MSKPIATAGSLAGSATGIVIGGIGCAVCAVCAVA